MTLDLKQSTAVTLKIGPFVDDSDGKTAETGLTITQAEVRLSKNGGDIAQKNEATSCTPDELGVYGCPIDTTDTNTLGRLQLWVHESGALPVFHEYMVLPANVWDSLYGSDRLQVDVREKGDSTLALTTQEKADANAEADTALSDYDPPTKTEMDTAHALLATVAKQDVIDGIVDDILADTGELQTDWVNGGRLDLLLDAALADTNELQTDWTNGGRLDLLIDAIKAITDTLVLADIADAVLDEVTEGTLTLRQVLRLLIAHHAGKSSGGGGATLTYRDYGDSKDRLVYAVDANGNRSAVTRDVS